MTISIAPSLLASIAGVERISLVDPRSTSHATSASSPEMIDNFEVEESASDHTITGNKSPCPHLSIAFPSTVILVEKFPIIEP